MKEKKKQIRLSLPALILKYENEKKPEHPTENKATSAYARKRETFLKQNSILKIWFNSMQNTEDESICLGTLNYRKTDGKRLFTLREEVMPAKRVKVITSLYFKWDAYKLEVLEVTNLEDGSKRVKFSAWLWDFGQFIPLQE